MSGQATGWVLRHGPRDRAQRAVLVAIADAATRTGENSHPGMNALVERSGYCRSKVFDTLLKLEKDGWIITVEKGVGRGHATVWEIPGVRASTISTGTPESVQQQLEFSPEEVSSPEPEKVQSRNLSLYSSTVENNEHRSESPQFLAFWEAYPHKIKRGAARRAFNDACTRTTSDRIIEAASRYARSRELPEMRWIPSPSSWLHDERWDDHDSVEPARPHLRSVGPDCDVCGSTRWVPESEGSERMVRCACVTEAVG